MNRLHTRGRRLQFYDEVFDNNLLLQQQFLVLFQITWADVEFCMMMNFPSMMGVSTNVEKFPKLDALKKRVDAHPKIAAYNANKPKPQ